MNKYHLLWLIGGAVVGYLAGNAYINAANNGTNSTITSVPGVLPAIQLGERAAGASV